VSQAKQPKERKFVWVATTVLHIQFVCMRSKGRARNRADFGAKYRRTRISGLKSELLSEFHYNNKYLLLFAGSFPGNKFL
jgi:hypothetical protein